MAFKLAEAYVEISQRGFSAVSSAIEGIKGRFVGLSGAISQLTSLVPGVGVALAALGTGAGITGMVSLAGAAEQVAVKFEVLLGSASAAKKMIEDLTTFSKQTPFSFGGLSSAVTLLLQAGRGVNEVMTDIEMLTNVASGNEQQLHSLAIAYQQVASNGRLMGQELMQLVNAGFNPLQILSEKTGQSMADLKKQMEQGALSFEDVRSAFVAATSEGGRFYRMNEKQGTTILGLWGTLQVEITQALADIGAGIVKHLNLKDATSEMTRLVQEIRTGLLPAAITFARWIGVIGRGLWEWRQALTVVGAVAAGVVTVLGALVTVQKAIAVGQAAILALSGPTGWAVLATGASLALAASSAVAQQFHELQRAVAAARNEAERTTSTFSELGSEAQSSAQQISVLHQSLVGDQSERNKALERFSALLRQVSQERLRLLGWTDADFELQSLERQGLDIEAIEELRQEYESLAAARKKANDQAERERVVNQFLEDFAQSKKTPVDVFNEKFALSFAAAGLDHEKLQALQDDAREQMLLDLGIADRDEVERRKKLEGLKKAFEDGAITESELATGIENLVKSENQSISTPEVPRQGQFMGLQDLGRSIQQMAIGRSERYQEQIADNSATAAQYLKEIKDNTGKPSVAVAGP